MTEAEYILGTEDAEIARLRRQHRTWVGQAYLLWKRARFGRAQTLVDLGSGPGFTSLELGQVVGPQGRVIAVDESARFLSFLDQERGRRELPWVEPMRARVEQLELPEASVDGAYSRWLFSWLEDPGAVVERVARALRPGAALVCQEYLDWAAMKLIPRSDVFDRAIDACMQSWAVDIDVAERLPTLAARSGLVLEHAAPLARVGAPGDPVWRWLGGFLGVYLPKLVTRGLLDEESFLDWRAEWAGRGAEETSRVVAPTMMDLVLRRPS